MPLIKSASKPAFNENVAEMIKAGHPRAQAVAASYANARKEGAKFAFGGAPDAFTRGAMHEIAHAGLIKSPIGGRDDKIPISVPSGSYILPSDHVSSLGQGNTINGAKILDRMFRVPAASHFHSTIPKPPRAFAAGGQVDGKMVPIIVSGGEYLLHPEQVAMVGGKASKDNHDSLDRWVTENRAQHIKTLKALPGPHK